ncbi:MAG: Fic family protein [Candidatus Woesearchaeota archaeon]|jgi:fido (protein-threonine AMPylation protein)|nr:Fic family protein [Candidatus Woesearchaeota archaeon]
MSTLFYRCRHNMTYLEKQVKNGQIYYYIAQSIRKGKDVNKVRVYVGKFDKALSEQEEINLVLDNIDKLDEKIDEMHPELSTDYKIEIFFKDLEVIFLKSDLLEIEITKKRFAKIKSNYDHYLNLRKNFVILHSYNSTKVEGNTMTQKETKLLLSEGIISELRELREANEVLNISQALDYIEDYNGELTVDFICEVHRVVTKNTLKEARNEGTLRPLGVNVFMAGSEYKNVPGGKLVLKLLRDSTKEFNNFYKKDKLGAIVRFYASFIAIHPFVDGNGRTSRILLNWLLKREGLPYINYDAKEHDRHIDGIDKAIRGKGFYELGQFVLEHIVENKFTK